MYVLIKGNHVYTLNNDLKSLHQKLDNDLDIVVKSSSDYRINENKKHHKILK